LPFGLRAAPAGVCLRGAGEGAPDDAAEVSADSRRGAGARTPGPAAGDAAEPEPEDDPGDRDPLEGDPGDGEAEAAEGEAAEGEAAEGEAEEGEAEEGEDGERPGEEARAEEAGTSPACPFTAARGERRADAGSGLSITNSGSGGRAGAGGGVGLAGLPRGGTCRSPGENGSSSRPNRTTTHSSDSAGSVSATTCPSCPAICPAAAVNITFGRRPPASPARTLSNSTADNAIADHPSYACMNAVVSTSTHRQKSGWPRRHAVLASRRIAQRRPVTRHPAHHHRAQLDVPVTSAGTSSHAKSRCIPAAVPPVRCSSNRNGIPAGGCR
jgi:hypothetical protein